MIFLVVYDTKAAQLLEVTEYEEAARDSAMEALRSTQERMIKDLGHVEVALFEGSSRATLERTHSRYFKSLKELGESLSDATKKSA
ncbi:MAG: hypothetical protein WA428_05125 [Candidatus Cybelea sp.]